jgi:hypothetical protein
MKTLLILLSGLIACNVLADNDRFVTVTAAATAYQSNGSTLYAGTNEVCIAEGETGQLMTALLQGNYARLLVAVQKDGRQYLLSTTPVQAGPLATLNGPGKFILSMDSGTANSDSSAMMTVKIHPEAYDPNKTVIIPPGTNHVAITMETSTNLVAWLTATNGIYGGPESARFFRIRMDKLD